MVEPIDPKYPAKCPYIKSCVGYPWNCPFCTPGKSEDEKPSEYKEKETT